VRASGDGKTEAQLAAKDPALTPSFSPWFPTNSYLSSAFALVVTEVLIRLYHSQDTHFPNEETPQTTTEIGLKLVKQLKNSKDKTCVLPS
jgi:hypothetical protein